MPNPYSAIFKAPGRQGLCGGRFRRAAADRDGADRHRRHAVADAWRVLAGRRRLGDLRADQRHRCTANLAVGRSHRPDQGGRADHRGFGNRLRGADGGGQSGLADLDAVRIGFSGRGDAQHPGDGTGALDRDFPRPPRTQHSLRLRIGGGRACLYRRGISVGGLERRVVPRGRNAGQYAVPRVRIGGVHRATRDGASRQAAGTWQAWLGDPAAARADHHLRPDLHRRDLRNRGSQRGGDHQGTRPAERR